MWIHRLSEGRPPLLLLAVLAGLLALLGCGEKTRPPSPGVQPTQVIVRLPIVTPRATATPAPATPRPTSTPAPTPTPLIHTIAGGDSLWDLSHRYGVSVSALQEANAILDPRKLQLGQELVIPQPEPEEEQGIPTPTPLAYSIRGLTFHRTSTGSLWCLGEVWNTTASTVEEVQVQVTLHNEAGRVVATGRGVPSLDAIAPGQRVPFALLFRDPPRSFAQYQAQPLRGTAALPGGSHYSDLAIVEDRGQMQGDYFVVEGQVRNTGTSAATMQLVATVYGAQGEVIGLRSDSPPGPLAPGAQSPFTVALLPVNQPVSSYAVHLRGLEANQGD
jgi:LysM repeat protein